MILNIKKLYNIFIVYIILLGISSCSYKSESNWITTSNNIMLWVSKDDSVNTFYWDGGSIDNIAHGYGELSVTDKDGKVVKSKVNMYYGTSSNDEVVTLDDGGKYVGAIVEGKMDGLGILAKNDELYIGNFRDSKPDGYVKLYKGNKLYYDGYWKAGVFNGEGTLYKEDGSLKVGEWINGRLSQTLVSTQLPQGYFKGYIKDCKPNGLGHMLYTDGSLYQGKWSDGLWNGEGLYVNGNDSVFGTWVGGKVQGDVILRTPQLFFEGTFIDNSPVGVGNLALADGSYYSGCWLDGNRQGNGDMVFSNGDSYMGEWAENTFNGFGVYEYALEKATYQGGWVDGLQHGQGMYNSPKFCYNGQWDKGWMDGDGTLVFDNGDKYEGTVHENIIDGIGCYTFANGNRYEGVFVNGKINGLGVFQFKKVDRYEGEFVNGKIYGDGTMYLVDELGTVTITGFWPKDGSFPKEASILFQDGDLYEGPLKNGLPTEEGTWTSGQERQEKLNKVNNSLAHKVNELYKKHRKTINWCLGGVSAFVTAVEAASASTIAGAPIAALAHGVNVAINVADASMAVGSAAIDLMESNQLGEDNTEAVQNLTTEVTMNFAFVLVPKIVRSTVKPLGTGVKYIARSSFAEQILKGGGNIVKKSALSFVKGKINGKAIRLKLAQNGRQIEKKLVRNKVTQKPMIALGRLLTQFKNQTVSYNSYLNQLKSNPNLNNILKLSVDGNSKNLGDNMRLFGTDKWVKKNERIRKYLGMPKRQVEPHHIIPSNPTTEAGRQAREIWVKYFDSVDHPCNGMWLGRSNKNLGYKALATGSNHSPNSIKYEQEVSVALINTYKAFQKKYANNPEMMQQVLAETVDNLKKRLYKGELAIGADSHTVHTAFSIFKEKSTVSVVSDVAQNTINLIMNLN